MTNKYLHAYTLKKKLSDPSQKILNNLFRKF